MFLSVFDIFKVGVGPSSSHTMGPMVAARRFLDALRDGADRVPGSGAPARVGARLHGSLAFTGKGHATDRAVILGLAGFDPGRLRRRRRRRGAGPPGRDRAARRPRACRRSPSTPSATSSSTTARRCPATPTAWCSRPGTPSGNLHLAETYYSVGGGFVLTERELARPERAGEGPAVPHPFATAVELVAAAEAAGTSIAGIQRANELALRSRGRARRRPRPDLGGDDRLHRPAASKARASCPAGSRSAAAPAASTSACSPSAART